MSSVRYDRKKVNGLLKSLQGLGGLFYSLINCIPESVEDVKDAMRMGRALDIGLSLSLQSKPSHKIKEEVSYYRDLYEDLRGFRLREMDGYDWYAKNEPYLIRVYQRDTNLLLASILEILETGKLSFETKKRLGWDRWGRTEESRAKQAWSLLRQVPQYEESYNSITAEQAVPLFRNTLKNLHHVVDLGPYTKAVEKLSGLRGLPQVCLSDWKVELRDIMARVYIDPEKKIMEVARNAKFRAGEVELIVYHEVLGHILLGSGLEAAAEDGLISRVYVDGAGSLPYSEGLAVWVEDNFSDRDTNTNLRKRWFQRRLRVMALRYVVTHEIYDNRKSLTEVHTHLTGLLSLDEIAITALLACRYARSYVYWQGYRELAEALSNSRGTFGEVHPFLCAIGRIPIYLATRTIREFL